MEALHLKVFPVNLLIFIEIFLITIRWFQPVKLPKLILEYDLFPDTVFIYKNLLIALSTVVSRQS